MSLCKVKVAHLFISEHPAQPMLTTPSIQGHRERAFTAWSYVGRKGQSADKYIHVSQLGFNFYADIVWHVIL